MKSKKLALLTCFIALAIPLSTLAATSQVLGWNNLGMHCMDSDYSVFSVLPPYNTIEAQLIVNGILVTNGAGYTVTYQAVADPEGSINKTAQGKGNFSMFDEALYGVNLPLDMGLAGWGMPGPSNTPQSMLFEATNKPAPGVAIKVNWFRAEGIPITPWDDSGRKNPYPLMRIIARSGSTPIATNEVVLPVSDEMDCRVCHASGTSSAAQPLDGWVWVANPERDFRLNILRLHDDIEFAVDPSFYQEALAARGFNPAGLYRGVVADGKPVLCAVCHASEALGLPSYGRTPPLTEAIHSLHASVRDPDLHIRLNDSNHRAACYRCHPGSTTKCLRGAMGGAVASDGTLEMQCQSCHGNMSAVGSSSRVGWFMEPNCQSCHTGTATSNSGQIRFTSCFDTNGTERLPANPLFATQPATPAPGLSLYRFSAGHGRLQCSACHGSTHAEFPATHRNDNLRNERIQGHAGTMVECTACHVSMPVNQATAAGGPHGMHPVGAAWVSGHHDFIVSLAACQACHGEDYRGTPLSRAHANRNINVSMDGTAVAFPVYRGAEIGCYNCHTGPFESNPNTTPAPMVTSMVTNTFNSEPLSFSLPVSGAGASARVISQPAHGSVAVSNNLATYFPEPGFTGPDIFTFAAYNGSRNSVLATGVVNVAQGPFSIGLKALVPSEYPANWPTPFGMVVTLANLNATPVVDWDFGDGSPLETNQHVAHIYAQPGTYHWLATATVQSGAALMKTNVTGVILVGKPVLLSGSSAGNSVKITWPRTAADAVLEQSPALNQPSSWNVCTNEVWSDLEMSVTMPMTAATYFRLRQVQ